MLLKNRGGALPLDARRLRSLAVIGPRADQAFTGGGGSSHVTPTRTVDPVSGLRQRLGSGVDVTFTKAGTTSGVPAIPASVLSGLQGEYFAGDTFDGTPALTRADPEHRLRLRRGLAAARAAHRPLLDPLDRHADAAPSRAPIAWRRRATTAASCSSTGNSSSTTPATTRRRRA